MPVRRHPIAVASGAGPLRALPLDQALIQRLRTTYNDVRRHELRLAELFYARLFEAAPALRPMFKSEPRAQAEKLTASLDAIVRNLESPEANAASLAELGKRHARYGARPEHYQLVIAMLVESMGEVLGPDAVGERLDEWRTALRLVSNQMIAAAESPAADVHDPHRR